MCKSLMKVNNFPDFFHSQDWIFVYITGISCNEFYAIKNCFLLITEKLLVKLLRIHVVPPTHPLRPGRNPYFRTFQVKKIWYHVFIYFSNSIFI